MSDRDVALSELRRLMGSDRLTSPKPRRDRQGRWHRDPAAEWDWYYALDKREQDYMRREYMGGHLSPEQLATDVSSTIDTTMDAFVANVRLARFTPIMRHGDPLDPGYEGAEVNEERVPWGYAEIAENLGVQQRTVHQWMARYRRGELDFPRSDLIVHGLPTWWSTTILDWAEETGRLAA